MPPPLSENPLVWKVILASASPRRRELLEAAGIDFEAVPTSVPERQREGEPAAEYVSRMAAEKAEAALALLPPSSRLPILAADTVVVFGRQTLGKPASEEEARRMLRLLSGKKHRVLTGLCLWYPPGPGSAQQKEVCVASTTVKFSELSQEEIEQYVATGEPLGKAGAYAIQGRASKFVEWVHGCYFNVVGLPVSSVYQMLKKRGSVGQERENFRNS